MPRATADANRRVTVEAVVLRADGTRVNLGVIASSDPHGPGTAKVDHIATDGQTPTTTEEA